jgi:Domain of unknown function (DUF927)
MSTYESPEERRQRAGIVEVPLPGKGAKKLNGGSHPQPDAFPKNGERAPLVTPGPKPAERVQSEPLPLVPPMPPAYVSVYPFTMSERGLFKRVRAKGADGGEEEGEEDTTVEKQVVRTVHIAPSFEILGKCRDPDGNSQGLLLRWSDDGRPRDKFIPYSALYGEAAALCGSLADGGLRPDERRIRDFKRYLNSVEIDARVTRVTRTGWHDICGKKVFVLSGVTIGNDSSGVVMLDGSDKAPYEANGTVDDWRNNIAKPAGDHLLLRLAISTALAGTLLYLAEAEGGGVNFHGSSSMGKTTLLRVAASVWGNGNSIKTWSATGNSFEASAVVTTDTFLAIDEIGIGGNAGSVLSALHAGQWARKEPSQSGCFDARDPRLARDGGLYRRGSGRNQTR